MIVEHSWSFVAGTPMEAMWFWETERGLCGIGFGDEIPAAELRRMARYGVAAPVPGEGRAALQRAVAQMEAYLAGRRERFDLPLDLRGTDFQRAVWEALLEIPYGVTWSYGQVAARVGHPRSARAVGQAVGANPLAVVVPCHRVIGGKGALTGYASGLERKRALLRVEGLAP